jgi:biopolymer transport protein TolQ
MKSILFFFTIITAGLYRGFEGSVLDLIINAGLVVKLVLLILLIFSIVSWAIIFFKFKLLRKADRETKEFLRIFRSKKDLSAIFSESRKYRQSPIAEIFRAGFTEVNKLKKNKNILPRIQASEEVFPSEDIDGVDRVLRQTNTAQTMQLERNLSFLATTGNAAPFIGLFGTVWGIMEAFHKIGQRGATSLAIVAPGISEALIATAAGLFAAIPAVIAYNYFLNRIRNLIAEMDNFTDEFLNTIKRYY